MNKHRKQRNWSQYNHKLKKIARIDFFISEEAIEKWYYVGERKRGGKILYSDHVIELCLMMKEYYGLAYRQTQGFVESLFEKMGLNLPIPDYTTMARRAEKLEVKLKKNQLAKKEKEHLVVAIDSTGLSLYTASQWNNIKHKKNKVPCYEKWRKLHIAIDVGSGEILASKYTSSTRCDGPELPGLLSSIDDEISAVCGDMAYDNITARKAIKERNARQLIPPIRRARLSKNNRNIKKYKEILQERDDAVNYIEHNIINGDKSMARASWKEKVGYHARSLVETTMFQIKSHTSDHLTNKKETTRNTQAMIKCKIVNLINAA